MNLRINQEFKEFIPPLTTEEHRQLEENILTEGCRDALVVWNDVIVDGHNRYEICSKHSLEFETRNKEFESEEAAKVWIIDNQNGRRNLTDGWKYELKQERKKLLAQQGQEVRQDSEQFYGNQHTGVLSQNDNRAKHNTRNELASELGWSTGKVAQADYVWKHGDEEVKEKVKAGELTFSGAYKDLHENINQTENKPRSDVALRMSESNEWYTPCEYIESAREVLGCIHIDPASCAYANVTVGADQYYDKEIDGLTKEWPGKVWTNPPYGGLTGPFVCKLIEQYEAGITTEAILLVNANSTDTKWFQPLWDYTLCFTNHRINFISSNDNNSGSTHGSVFIYLGDNPAKFAREFRQYGNIVRRWDA